MMNPVFSRLLLPLAPLVCLVTALALGPGLPVSVAHAQEVWSVGNQRISLEVGEGKFIRLPEPAKAVFLSNPKAAEIDLQSARYLYVVGKQIGQTNLFVLGENDEEIMSATLSVTVDIDRLARAANRAVMGGSVQISAVEGAVFLSGTVKSDEDIASAGDVVAGLLGPNAIVVNTLALETLAQVNLQVRIAEVSRSISEDLGISLTATSSNGKRGFTPPPNPGGGFNINVSAGTRNINLMLDALARNGLVSILSEPNLTARSGEKASFLAGGRVPYPERGENGETTYRLEPIGVELDFTPTVRGPDQIEIELTTRVRDIDTSTSETADAPSLTERSATTTVELGSGQSFAIAGMFRANSNQSIQELPGIAKLPVIGALFRSSRFARGETELVIIVTPYLVKPGNPDDFETPVDRVQRVETGLEQAVTGRMTRPPLRQPEGASSRVRASGFVLE